MSDLFDGYNFYRDIQGTKYDKNNLATKQKLQDFRKKLGDFTDLIFKDKNDFIALEKGHWQNSGNYTKYMWNRYKPKEDNSTLVIYFNASTRKNEGLFVSIGLIDDRLTEFEKKYHEKIYNFLEEGCRKINSEGFERKNTGWGERVFSVIDEHKFESLDYNDLIGKLKNLYDETYSKFYVDKFHNSLNVEENKMPTRNKTTLPLNQILYGPPGTGKTYNTINKALEIIDGFAPQNRTEAKAKFEEYKKSGQIEFVTFHQSYGYEEFVEGIKAEIRDKNISYEVKPGIFKKLSKQAKENYENSQKSLEKLIQEKSLQQKIEQFLNDSLEEQREFTKTKGGKFKIKDIRDTSIFVFTEDSNYNENILELDIDELFKILDSDIDFKTSRQLAKDVFGINNQRQKDTYYFSMYKEFQKQKFDVVEEEKLEEPLKNYILIIDEINRGNISKIFGELITLIEPSKRIGADEEIKVKLPYSNEEFGVPSNLYIIGTMNTADRSIALMDTALRRRFDFEEMMPQPDLLSDFEVKGINIKAMLEKINKRVEYLYDRDHTIGHAYFMSLKENPSLGELENIFRNKIIPLLQEYFYDDWEKILMVLGDGFVQKSEIKSDIFDYKQDDYLEDEKFVYVIKENFDFGKFK